MLDLYNKCFNEDGTVKACGREACKQLIRACMEQDPTKDFGNPDTGMMHVQNIISLIKNMN